MRKHQTFITVSDKQKRKFNEKLHTKRLRLNQLKLNHLNVSQNFQDDESMQQDYHEDSGTLKTFWHCNEARLPHSFGEDENGIGKESFSVGLNYNRKEQSSISMTDLKIAKTVKIQNKKYVPSKYYANCFNNSVVRLQINCVTKLCFLCINVYVL